MFCIIIYRTNDRHLTLSLILNILTWVNIRCSLLPLGKHTHSQPRSGWRDCRRRKCQCWFVLHLETNCMLSTWNRASTSERRNGTLQWNTWGIKSRNSSRYVSTWPYQSSLCRLVPKPCAFLTCSQPFCTNSALQVTIGQRPMNEVNYHSCTL